jgi:hypothetical protein
MMLRFANLNLQGLLWLGLLILSLLGCKKVAEQRTPPQLNFSTGANELSLQIPDSVIIGVVASDAAGLKRLSLTLVDASFQRVSAVQEVPLTGELSYSHTFNFGVTSEQLRSGVYYLLATASNGSSEGRKFIKILLKEAPLRLNGILVLSENGSQTDVTVFKPNFSHHTMSWTGSYAGGAAIAATSSYLAFEANRPQVRVLTAPDFNVLAGFVPAVPNTKTLSVTSHASELVYAAFENGQVLGYSRDLKQVFQYSSPSTAFPVFIHRLPQHLLIVEQQRANVDAFHMYMIHPVAKGIINSRSLDFVPVYVFEESPNTLVFFGNRQGKGVIVRYYFSSNLFTTLREFPSGKKIDSVFYDELGGFTVFQLVLNEELFTYNTDTDQLNTGFGWQTGFGVSRYEPLTQTWVFFNRNEPNGYKVFLDRLGLTSDMVQLAGRPLAIQFIYNR